VRLFTQPFGPFFEELTMIEFTEKWTVEKEKRLIVLDLYAKLNVATSEQKEERKQLETERHTSVGG